MAQPGPRPFNRGIALEGEIPTEEVRPQRFVEPQRFVPAEPLRTVFGRIAFDLTDTVNTGFVPLATAHIIAERVLIENRAHDDVGGTANGNYVLIADGRNVGAELSMGSAYELLNADLSRIFVAYGGAAALIGAQFVLVGWIAHGVVRYGPKEISAVVETEKV